MCCLSKQRLWRKDRANYSLLSWEHTSLRRAQRADGVHIHTYTHTLIKQSPCHSLSLSFQTLKPSSSSLIPHFLVHQRKKNPQIESDCQLRPALILIQLVLCNRCKLPNLYIKKKTQQILNLMSYKTVTVQMLADFRVPPINLISWCVCACVCVWEWVSEYPACLHCKSSTFSVHMHFSVGTKNINRAPHLALRRHL